MPNKRHARRTHRDAARLASAGNHRTALAIFERTAVEYRAWLTVHPADEAVRADLADLLAAEAVSATATGLHGGAAAALAERLELLAGLEIPAAGLAPTQLDLAEAHLRCGRLMSAVSLADSAIRAFDDTADAADPAFAALGCALARNARILSVAADPDLAVGAADQAVRMLMVAPGRDAGGEVLDRLHQALVLAARLHGAAGRGALARAASDRLERLFPDRAVVEAAPASVSLRQALHAAGRLGVFADRDLVERLCPDPGGPASPPAVSARCDPALAAIALHATAGAVESLRASHAGLAWRVATEVHYLLDAADRQGERGLRLNFRDHGPVWLGMLLDVTEAVGGTGPLAEDLASVLDRLLERLLARHAVDERSNLVVRTRFFIAANRSGTELAGETRVTSGGRVPVGGRLVGSGGSASCTRRPVSAPRTAGDPR